MFTIKCDVSYSWAGSKSIAILWEGYGWWELWEHSLPTNVARVQILASSPCMGRVNLLSVFSFAPRFFVGYSGFPLFLQTTSKAKEKCPGDEVALNSNSTRSQESTEPLSTRYWIEYFNLHIGLFPSLSYFEPIIQSRSILGKVVKFGGHNLNGFEVIQLRGGGGGSE